MCWVWPHVGRSTVIIKQLVCTLAPSGAYRFLKDHLNLAIAATLQGVSWGGSGAGGSSDVVTVSFFALRMRSTSTKSESLS